MSSINSVGGNTPINRVVSSPIQKSIPTDAGKPMPATDKLNLSGLSHLLHPAKQADVRTDKVASVKSAIEAGAYEIDHKLDGAIDKLLDELNK